MGNFNRTVKGLLLSTRPFMAMLTGVTTMIAVRVATTGAFPWVPALILSISNALFSASSMVINDWFDVDIDQINKPFRPLPSGTLRMRTALAASVGMFAVGLVGTFYLKTSIGILATIGVVLSVAYSWVLKKKLILNHLTVASLTGYLMLSAGLLVGDLSRLGIPLVAITLFIFGREIIKTVEDTEGDRTYRVRTIANLWGIRVAVPIGLAFMLIASLTSTGQYFLGINNGWFLVFRIIELIALIGLGARILADMSPKSVSRALDYSAGIMLFAICTYIVGLR